jgi:hypothetical protein
MKLCLFFSLICLINIHNNQINTIIIVLYCTTIVTFGDSLSDTETDYQILSHTRSSVPPLNSNGSYADSLLIHSTIIQ